MGIHTWLYMHTHLNNPSNIVAIGSGPNTTNAKIKFLSILLWADLLNLNTSCLMLGSSYSCLGLGMVFSN